jgi:hypothetical protein
LVEDRACQIGFFKRGSAQDAFFKAHCPEGGRHEYRTLKITILEEDILKLGIKQLDTQQSAPNELGTAEAGSLPVCSRQVRDFSSRVSQAYSGQVCSSENGASKMNLLEQNVTGYLIREVTAG